MDEDIGRSFMEVSTPVRRNQMGSGVDASMITTFLETCMKLLRDSKVVQGLQALITRCVGSDEPYVVQKIGRHALRIGGGGNETDNTNR